MLTDPAPAPAEQSSFVNGLVGLASLSRLVRALGSPGPPRAIPPVEADDFVHLLLAVVSLGEATARLAQPEPERLGRPDLTATQLGAWLR